MNKISTWASNYVWMFDYFLHSVKHLLSKYGDEGVAFCIVRFFGNWVHPNNSGMNSSYTNQTSNYLWGYLRIHVTFISAIWLLRRASLNPRHFLAKLIRIFFAGSWWLACCCCLCCFALKSHLTEKREIIGQKSHIYLISLAIFFLFLWFLAVLFMKVPYIKFT